jgi:hypothetical protein
LHVDVGRSIGSFQSPAAGEIAPAPIFLVGLRRIGQKDVSLGATADLSQSRALCDHIVEKTNRLGAREPFVPCSAILIVQWRELRKSIEPLAAPPIFSVIALFEHANKTPGLLAIFRNHGMLGDLHDLLAIRIVWRVSFLRRRDPIPKMSWRAGLPISAVIEQRMAR